MIKKIITFSLSCLLILQFFVNVFNDSIYAVVNKDDTLQPLELLTERTETSKKYYLGGNEYAVESSVNILHYKDNYTNIQELWKNIDLTIVDNQITKAPYTLDINNATLTYKIIDKKTNDSLIITGVGALRLFNTGFRLARQIDSPNELWKSDAEFDIIQHGDSISILSLAYDATGKPINVTSNIINGKLIEKIDSKALIDVVYPITIDPTIEVSVNASSNDFRAYYNSSIWAGDYTTTYSLIGNYNSGFYKSGAGHLFADVNIPVGAEINTAYGVFTAGSSQAGTTCNAVIIGQKSASPVTFSDIADYQSRRGTICGGDNNTNLTTANVSWNNLGAWTEGNTYNTPEIKTIIQEIIDLEAWQGDGTDDIVIFIDDHAGTSSETARRAPASFDNVSYDPLMLHIEYTAEECNTPTLSNASPTGITISEVELHTTIVSHGSSNITDALYYYDVDSGSPYAENITGELCDYIEPPPACFGASLSDLIAGENYFYIGGANNTCGWSWETESRFMTSPYPLTSVSINSTGYNWIKFNLTKGTGQDFTEICYSNESYPSDNTSGNNLGWHSGTTANVSIPCGTTGYFSFFSIAEDDSYYSISSTKLTQEASTSECVGELEPPTNIVVTNEGAITTNISWVKGNNSTYTMIRASILDYPESTIDGELIYYGTSANYTTTDFLIDKTWYSSAWGFDSDNITYSAYYTIFNIGGDDLVISHLLALLPLFVLLVLSLVFHHKGLIHIMTFAYSAVLAYMAITGGWELLFFPCIMGVAVISLILFMFSMSKGVWL